MKQVRRYQPSKHSLPVHINVTSMWCRLEANEEPSNHDSHKLADLFHCYTTTIAHDWTESDFGQDRLKFFNWNFYGIFLLCHVTSPLECKWTKRNISPDRAVALDNLLAILRLYVVVPGLQLICEDATSDVDFSANEGSVCLHTYQAKLAYIPIHTYLTLHILHTKWKVFGTGGLNYLFMREKTENFLGIFQNGN